MNRKQILGLTIGAIALVILAAAAGAWITQERDASNEAQRAATTAPAAGQNEPIQWNDSRAHTQPQTQAQPQVVQCDDGNIVGKIVGGVGGGVAGSQIGSGSGKTAATIGGTMAGSYLGEEYLPTKNVTCR